MRSSKKQNIILWAQLALGILCIYLLLKPSPQVIEISKPKEIQERIKEIEGRKEVYYNGIQDEKKISAALRRDYAQLQIQLDSIRKAIKPDTFEIVQLQDTIINVLRAENFSLRKEVRMHDSLHVMDRYIINSKDTIIAYKDFDIKRIKKQRNWSLLANGVLTGLLIIK